MLIGHYMHDLWAPGGVASYIGRLSCAQKARGDEVVFFDSAAPSSADVVHVSDARDMVRAALQLQIDVLHLHLVPSGEYPPGVPTVRTVHGHQPYCPSGTQFLGRRGLACNRKDGLAACTWGHLVDHCGSVRPLQLIDDFRRTRNERRLAQSMLLLANSEFVRTRLLRAGYPADRVRVLRCPAPLPLRGTTESAGLPGPRVLYLGRLTPSKGVDWLLSALDRTSSPIALDIAGTGEDERRLRQIADGLDLGARVVFHGWVSEPETADLCAAARAVVVPSLWHEPAGLVAVEAAAYGRPVVASAVGGLPEMVVEGVTGLVVAPGDVDGLAGAIRRLCDDADLAARLGENGRVRARRDFRLDAHLNDLDVAYEEAMAHG